MSKKYSYWLVSGKFSMMQKIIVVFTGLLTFMLLARMYTPEVYGVWGLFMIISSIVETSRNAFIKNGYIVFINKSEESERSKVETAAFLTNVIFTIIFIIFFLCIGGLFEKIFKSEGLYSILALYSLTLILLIPFSQRENYLSARTNFKGIFWMYTVRNGTFMLLIAFLFFMHLKVSLNTITILYGVSTLGGVIAGYFPLSKIGRLHIDWDKSMFLRFVHYGKYVLGNNLCALIFRNTDSFMTARFISPAGLAFYNSCTRIMNLTDMPTQVMGDVMFPKAAQIVKTGNINDIRRIYEKTVAATLTLTIPVIIVIFLFPKEILYVLAGKKYLPAAALLKIVIFYGLFLPFIKQFGNIMDATGRPHGNFLTMLIAAIFNIFSNYFFIHWLGLPGAAYGTLFSYFVLFVITQIVLTRLIGINQINIVKNMFSLYVDYFNIIQNYIFKRTKYSYER